MGVRSLSYKTNIQMHLPRQSLPVYSRRRCSLYVRCMTYVYNGRRSG